MSLVVCEAAGFTTMLAYYSPARLKKFAHRFTDSRKNFEEVKMSLIDEGRESQTVEK